MPPRRERADDDLGRWDPLPLAEAVDLFAPAGFRWWVSGGRALDLYVGRTWRRHGDLDIGLCRGDAPRLRALLAGWDIAVASGGTLAPWTSDEPSLDGHQNNLWCRRSGDPSWRIDVTVGDGDQQTWIFRRDPSIRVPWDEAVLTSPAGVPYLAPHLVLLFKSRDPLPKDTIDAIAVAPHLAPEQAALVAGQLAPGHPWAELFD